MGAPVAYDVTRLFMGPLSRTPRGIDRVEIAYARHFFGVRRDCVGVLPTPWGVRCYQGDRILRGLERLEKLWSEVVQPEDDPIWRQLRARLAGGAATISQSPRMSVGLQAQRMTSLLRATGIGLGAPIRRALDPHAVYLNVGQIALTIPFLLRWIDRRPDVSPVFMLHDVIPIDTPEYVDPIGVSGHARMLEMTAKYAKGLITTTKAARASIDAALLTKGRLNVPTIALHLPISDAFSPARGSCAPPTAQPYFVACGAIEPRKNYALLSEIWKRLKAEMGADCPHLVVVGEPGWTSDSLRLRLTRSPQTQDRLHVVSGLSTPALRDLLAGARGLLMPSFTEGFGLPIREAQALGTSVIASDIPAHREVSGPGAQLIDPLDGPAWGKAIASLSRKRPDHAPSQHGPDWVTYFEAIDGFIAGLRRNRRGPADDIIPKAGARTAPRQPRLSLKAMRELQFSIACPMILQPNRLSCGMR